MAQVIEVRKSGIGTSAVVLTVTSVDNEVTVALNGTEIAHLVGPPGFTNYSENLTTKLIAGKPNVLVFTLVNYDGGGFNPASCAAKLDIGTEEINLSASSGAASVTQGLFAQTIVVLEL